MVLVVVVLVVLAFVAWLCAWLIWLFSVPMVFVQGALSVVSPGLVETAPEALGVEGL